MQFLNSLKIKKKEIILVNLEKIYLLIDFLEKKIMDFM